MYFFHRTAAFVVFFTIVFCSTSYGQKSNTVLSLRQLQAPVEILRDKWGVNHIYAKNQHDLFFAQGYCAAKDRLFQFEIWRRQATGTIAEILGPRELKRDIGTRLFKFRGDMKTELAHYHPQGIAIINAYVDGVNACIEAALLHPEKLPIEFHMLHILPGKWTPEVVISRHQGLLGNISEEMAIGRAVAKAGAEKVKDLVWFHPGDPVINLDTAIRADLLDKDILELYNAYRDEVVFQKAAIDEAYASTGVEKEQQDRAVSSRMREPVGHGLEGSNNWIVSGSRTASGHTMLANDPHRKIAVPSLRYIVHLVAPGWNVIGGGEPEIPGVSIGHNQFGAWGLTIFETDGEDLYVYDLNPADLTQYSYKGRWVAMKEIKETIAVKGAGEQQVILRYTVHGPVTFIDSANHKAYAVKCAWLEPGGAPYLASLRIDQSTNWDNFRDACSYSNIPGENMIWADKTGNIGWQAVGITPIRKNFSGLVPVPGDGRYEWDGYLPIKERPHLLNPAKGFFATANQHVTPAGYTHMDALSYTWADAFRGNRINEALEQDNKITIEKMEALQTDYLSLPARTLVPMLRKLEFDSGLVKQAGALLMKWNFVLDKNKTAPGIYAMWERVMMEEANKKFIPAELKGLIGLQTTKLIGWLQTPDQRFGADPTKGRDLFLQETFRKAIDKLVAKLGNNINDWTYGQDKYKHVELIHQLGKGVNDNNKKVLNIGPLPRGGNGHTVGSTGDTDNQLSGASFRLIVDTGDWDKAVMINTPGQSGDPASPFYRNLFPLWANDTYFPAYYSKDKILQVTATHTFLQPSKK